MQKRRNSRAKKSQNVLVDSLMQKKRNFIAN